MDRVPFDPPLIPFDRRFVGSTIRSVLTSYIYEWPLQQSVITVPRIFDSCAPVTHAFDECKILEIRVWNRLDFDRSESGLFVMAVVPGSYQLSNQDTTFEQIVALPGSSVGKLYDTLHGVYYPTQPSDKNWIRVAPPYSEDPLCSILFMLEGWKYKKDVTHTVTLDTKVTMRGSYDYHYTI